jgi:hypothetical protein
MTGTAPALSQLAPTSARPQESHQVPALLGRHRAEAALSRSSLTSVGEDGRFERVGTAVVQVSRSIGQPPYFVPVIAFLVWLGVTQIKDRRRKG